MPKYPVSGTVGQQRVHLSRTSLLTNQREPPLNPYLTATWSLQPRYPQGKDLRPSKRCKSFGSSTRSSRGRSLCTVLPLSPEAAKPERDDGHSLQSLPNDVLANICFSGYLDTIFVHTSVMLVCKRIRHVAQRSFLALDLRALRLTNSSLSRLFQAYRNVETLDLSFCKSIDDDAIKRLLPLHQTLTSLNLRGCPISDRGLEAIANLRRLRHLDVSRSTVEQAMVITDEGLAALRPLRDLRTIGLAWNKRITDDGVAMLSGSVRAISTINLQCCTMLSDETCKLISSHPLQAVDLGGCSFITDQGVRNLSTVPTLEWLSVAHCYYLTDYAVDLLLGHTKLKWLDLRDCFLISPAARERIQRAHPAADLAVS